MKSPNHSSRTSCVRSRELHHGAIGPAFCAYVLEDGDGSSQFLETFALHLASLSGPLAATGHYLLARNFEADDRGLDVRER